MTMKVLLKDGDNTLLIGLELGCTYYIGRSRDCEITVTSKNASGKHCRLTYIRSGLFVDDCESKNGTLVNGKKIDESTQLFMDSILSIGDIELTVYKNRLSEIEVAILTNKSDLSELTLGNFTQSIPEIQFLEKKKQPI